MNHIHPLAVFGRTEKNKIDSNTVPSEFQLETVLTVQPLQYTVELSASYD